MFNLDIIKKYVSEKEEIKSDPNLTKHQQKVIQLFNQKCENTILSALIGESPYGVFLVNPQKIDSIIASFESGNNPK